MKKSTISVFPVSLGHKLKTTYHNHPFHELYFSLSEGGIQYAAKEHYPLKKRQLFTLPSPVYHFCRSNRDTHPVDAVVLFVHQDVFSGSGYADVEARRMLMELVRMGRDGQHEVPIQEETGKRLEEILVPLSTKNVKSEPGYALDIRSGFEQVLVALMRDPAYSKLFTSHPPGAEQRLERVFYFVENQFAEPITIDDVCRITGLSRSHFHALFKQTAGCTFVEHLNTVRLEKACDMLTHGDLPLMEVGWSCGFESVAHFYRCFRKKYKIPPGKYRQQAQLTPA